MIRLVLIAVIAMIVIIALLVGCSSKTDDEPENDNDDDSEADYEIDYDSEAVVRNTNSSEAENNSPANLISGSEARELFETDDRMVLLDVRNQDEYDEYHIVDSVLIPVDELESRLSELPDKDALIIVFCRAGRRSAIAAGILTANGYTNVRDMQSIKNW